MASTLKFLTSCSGISGGGQAILRQWQSSCQGVSASKHSSNHVLLHQLPAVTAFTAAARMSSQLTQSGGGSSPSTSSQPSSGQPSQPRQAPLQGTSTAQSSGTKSGNKGWDGKPKSAGGRNRVYFIAGLVGVGAGVAYSGWKKREELKRESTTVIRQVTNEAESNIKPFLLSERPPHFKPARRIRGAKQDNQGLKLTLYQYATCPFCCKARAFLDYMGLSYDVIEVNSVMRKQVKWSKYKKVPILVAETATGEVLQLNDSSMIISALYSYLIDPSKGLAEYLAMYPQIKYIDSDGKTEKTDMSNKYFIMFQELDVQKRKQDVAQERKWRQWVDNTFVHTLSPNVYRTPQESLAAFRWFNEVGNWEEHFSAWERFVVVYVGAAVMWIIGKRLQKRHGLKQDVRQSFYDETNNWLKAVKQRGGKFLGGDKPNLADLAVYGALSAVEGCEAFLDLQANTNIKPWFEATKRAIEDQRGAVVVDDRINPAGTNECSG